MIKFVDLFAGIGGMRLGFEQAMTDLNIEHKCVLSSEINKNAQKTYELNFSEKTKVISLEFDKLEAFQKYGKNFWISQKEKDFEEYHTHELYAIWYEKKEFVKKAIELNPFQTNKFVWCDAGICRNEDWKNSIKTFPVSYKIPNDKFLVLRITDFEQHDDFLKINCVGGGILAARKELWLEFAKNHFKSLLLMVSTISLLSIRCRTMFRT